MKIAFCALALLFFIPAYAEQIIRVRVANGLTKVALKGSGMTASSAEAGSLAKGSSLEVSINNGALALDKKELSSPIVTVTSKDPIAVNGIKYRSPIEIRLAMERAGGTLMVIHPMGMENYIGGIVSGEVPKTWPLEALKAQAIAARTYASWQKYRRLNESYHVDSSVSDQVYNGMDTEHSKAAQAAQETYGEVLTYDDKPIEAYFHSTCGGHTENAKDIWGRNAPYLPGSSCGYCKEARFYRWKHAVAMNDFKNAFSIEKNAKVKSIRIRSKTKVGRAKKIDIVTSKGTKTFSGESFRKFIGYTKLRSAWLNDISIHRDNVDFSGRGYGHGIGVCQEGAHGMAKAGKNGHEIVLHYYPGAEIRKMY